MDKKQMKLELANVCEVAIRDYLCGLRGVNAFGANAKIVKPTPLHLQIQSRTQEHGLAFFELLVKEAH